jgi:hypothetical protein
MYICTIANWSTIDSLKQSILSILSTVSIVFYFPRTNNIDILLLVTNNTIDSILWFRAIDTIDNWPICNIIVYNILVSSSYPHPTTWGRYNVFFIMLWQRFGNHFYDRPPAWRQPSLKLEWVLTIATGTNGLTCLPKHRGARDNKEFTIFLYTVQIALQRLLGGGKRRKKKGLSVLALPLHVIIWIVEKTSLYSSM